MYVEKKYSDQGCQFYKFLKPLVVSKIMIIVKIGLGSFKTKVIFGYCGILLNQKASQ